MFFGSCDSKQKWYHLVDWWGSVVGTLKMMSGFILSQQFLQKRAIETFLSDRKVVTCNNLQAYCSCGSLAELLAEPVHLICELLWFAAKGGSCCCSQDRWLFSEPKPQVILLEGGEEDLSQFLIGAHAAELSAGNIATNYVLLKSTCNRLPQRWRELCAKKRRRSKTTINQTLLVVIDLPW